MRSDRVQELYEELQEVHRQIRGEEPAEFDFETGYHPDQLMGYPLQRIGPRMYATDIEGVILTDNDRDRIVVEASEMDEYSLLADPSPEEFQDSRIWFSIRDERTDVANMSKSLTQQGQATLTYQNMDEYLEGSGPGSYDTQPNILLETGRNRHEKMDDGDWEKLLNNSFTTLELLN